LGTQLSDVIDLFLSSISDYRLDTIYTTSGSVGLNTYVEPWLLDSIDMFDVCDQDLTYTPISGSADGYFDQTLTQRNKNMLGRIMVIPWLQKGVQDLRQLENILGDHDFHIYSPAQNLKARQDYINSKREEISQKLVDYGMGEIDWNSWKTQNF
jgi:hypothetical protein